MICLILLAGMGIGAPVSFNSREKYLNYEVKIEQVDSKEEEVDEESEEEKH